MLGTSPEGITIPTSKQQLSIELKELQRDSADAGLGRIWRSHSCQVGTGVARCSGSPRRGADNGWTDQNELAIWGNRRRFDGSWRQQLTNERGASVSWLRRGGRGMKAEIVGSEVVATAAGYCRCPVSRTSSTPVVLPSLPLQQTESCLETKAWLLLAGSSGK